jgi:hypothetical protein
MGFMNKKRLLLTAGGISTVAAAGMLVAGTTLGLFSATNTQATTNSFTAGTVKQGSPATTTCTITNMVPGDSSTGFTSPPTGRTNAQSAPCSFAVTYTGSAPAYIGVDVAVGGTSLYDGTANGLQLQIKDGSTSYTTTGALNGNSNLLFSATPDAGASNTVHTVVVNYALPTAADNTYQALATTLTITVHSVQSGNNNFVGACTAGNTCGTAADWS